MTKAVICGYARSPFSFAHKGELIKARPDDMAATVIRGLINKTGVNSADMEDIILGCAFPEGEQGFNIARLVGLLADLPLSVGGVTVNRFCGSSMQAIHMAAGNIAAGAGEVFIAGGVESMTRIPMGGFNPSPNAVLYEKSGGAYMPMGETAENVANKYGISRQQQEQLAFESHRKATQAQQEGRFKEEIIPLSIRGQDITTDSCIRADTTLEGLSKLKPAFDEKGTVTAGTSSPLTDGAAAVLVCSEQYARDHNLGLLARIKSFAICGVEPELMGIGPVPASQKALIRAGLSIDDMDIIELNEAFASQALACIKELKIDPRKVNKDGGALALGHPLGATGARITGKAATLLKREGKKYALATQCIGSGQGIATILEAVE